MQQEDAKTRRFGAPTLIRDRVVLYGSESPRRECVSSVAPTSSVFASSRLPVASLSGASRLDDAVFFADFGEGFEGAVELGAFVRGHVAGAQHGALGRDAGRDEGVRVDAVLFQQVAPHHD